MEEVLRITVRLEEICETKGHLGSARMIAFSGEADGPYFTGKILPHGVDTQTEKTGETMQLSARYMLSGTDHTGQPCRLFIENNGTEDKNGIVTSPQIYTDSEALAWMEKAVLTGSVEGCGENQVVIHIRRAEAQQYAFRVEKCSIAVGDNRIFASLYLPECEQRVPAVALSHGYNGKGNDFREEAAYFAANGIAACTFDFCGGSVGAKSSGSTKEMSVLTEKEDLKAVVSFLKERPEMEKDSLFLFGGSQGGFVSLLTAAECPEEIRALVLYYPALCIPDDWRKEYPDPSQIPESREFWGMELGRCYFEAAVRLDAFQPFETVKQKILLFHGDQDEIVPVSYAEKAAQVGKNVELEILPGEKHGFSGQAGRYTMEKALAFMKSICRQNGNLL